MSEKIESEECCVCHLDVVGEDLAWAKEQANHPGVLGILHPQCYNKTCDEEPAAPWTDPISGEVDFDGMAEDLGCPEMGDNYDGEGEEAWNA